MSTLAQTQASRLDELVRRIVEAVNPLRIILIASTKTERIMCPVRSCSQGAMMSSGHFRRIPGLRVYNWLGD